jgi:hypothetical protein
MHPLVTVKHLGHELHDGIVSFRQHIDQHLHSRHFWTGIGAALLAVGVLTLLIMLAAKMPLESIEGYPTGMPFTPYMR